jgi:RsmE family RNA methyltransferase
VPGKDARHLVRVLRLGPGDSFPAIDAEGRRHSCEILDEIEEGALSLAVGPAEEEIAAVPRENPLPDVRGGSSLAEGHRRGGPADSKPVSEPATEGRNSLPRIILAAAMLKGEKFDLVLRQATEAGVARIIPFTSARSLGTTAGRNKRERQERIVREALQQSGSKVRTRIDELTKIDELPDRLGEATGRRLSLLLHEAPLVEIPLHRYLGDRADEIVLCVGPEGGFAPDEIEFLRGRGFQPLRLPGAVLRADTAAIFVIAAVEAIYSEQGAWSLV